MIIDHFRAKAYYYIGAVHFYDVIAVFLILVGLLFFLSNRKERMTWKYCIYICIFALYDSGLLLITLLGRSGISIEDHRFTASLLPRDYYDLLFNVVMFIPAGILLLIKHKVFLSVLMVAAMTVSIESLQFIMRCGRFEVIDIVANCAGGLLGIGIYYLFRMVKTAIQK